MKTAAEMRQQLSEKAGTDEAFRQKLLDDPRGTIESEFDVALPAGFSVSVLEDSADHAHLVIPPSSLIPDSDLESVSGGIDRWGSRDYGP